MQWHRKSAEVSGAHLVADFQAAVANVVTMETANYAAEQSEHSILESLQAASTASHGGFLAPGDIPQPAQEEIVRSSIDAHIKKIQARQISGFTAAQVAQLQAEDKRKYVGRRVRIRTTDDESRPLESVWFDERTGQYRTGELKAKTVKGIIDDIVFDKNLLVLKPLLVARTFLPDRKYFLVSVINLKTGRSAVELTLM